MALKNVTYIEVEGKRIALKKSGNSYRVIHPWINENGSWNWFNILTGGSWWNLIIVAFFVFVICMAIREYVNNIQSLLDCFQKPGMLQNCINSYTPESLKIIPRIS